MLMVALASPKRAVARCKRFLLKVFAVAADKRTSVSFVDRHEPRGRDGFQDFHRTSPERGVEDIVCPMRLVGNPELTADYMPRQRQPVVSREVAEKLHVRFDKQDMIVFVGPHKGDVPNGRVAGGNLGFLRKADAVFGRKCVAQPRIDRGVNRPRVLQGDHQSLPLSHAEEYNIK